MLFRKNHRADPRAWALVFLLIAAVDCIGEELPAPLIETWLAANY